jgi:hypothetical protein
MFTTAQIFTDTCNYTCETNGDLYCDDIGATAIIIPLGVENIWCRNNKLTELELPEGIYTVVCNQNRLTSLNIPDSVETLMCDKDLFDYDTCKAKQINIYYE